MYVVEVVGVAKDSNDRSNASPCADEAPKTNNPGTRRGEVCSSISKPAANPWRQVSKSSLDNALGGNKGVPYRHREQVLQRRWFLKWPVGRSDVDDQWKGEFSCDEKS